MAQVGSKKVEDGVQLREEGVDSRHHLLGIAKSEEHG